MVLLWPFCWLLLLAFTIALNNPRRPAGGKQSGNQRARYQAHHHLDPSLSSISSIDGIGKFALTSVTVQHRGDSRWYLPHYHARGSSGWNRTHVNSHIDRPIACNIRFFAIGLEKTLRGFTDGGTAYMTVEYYEGKKGFYHGFNKNETGKLHCYYMTNKGYGSEFLDKPKTLGIAIYCPLSMDSETGEYAWNSGTLINTPCYTHFLTHTL